MTASTNQTNLQGDTLNPLAYRLAAEANLGLGNYREAGAMFDEAERLRPIYTIETERTRELAWIDRYQAAAPLVNPDVGRGVAPHERGLVRSLPPRATELSNSRASSALRYPPSCGHRPDA